MSKNIIRGTIIVVILYIVYNVLALVIPFNHTTSFWLAYIFGSIAILVQLPLLYFAFCKENSPKSRFYGFPIAQVGTFYLITQLILSFLTMIIGNILPVWVVAVVYIVLFGGVAIGFIGVDAMRDEVERQEHTDKKNTDTMRSLQLSASTLIGLCTDTSLSKQLEKLAEEFKYSDPVTNEQTISVEKELTDILLELKDALTNSDTARAEALCKKTKLILEERNHICKANK